MTFTITANEYVNDHFIKWLLRIIRFQIIKNINHKKLLIFNEIVDKENIFEKSNPYDKNKFDVRKAVVISLNNLQINRIKNVYIIRISDNVVFPGYNVKLSTICKLLNYGNTNIKGYPIYTQAFDNVRLNLKKYYQQYIKQTLRR